MTNKEILEIDFYDFFGSASCFMTSQEKIDWWRSVTKD